VDASGNRLTTLPSELSRLGNLKVLTLDGNGGLSGLPMGLLAGCSSLHSLSLHGTPITAADLESDAGWPQYETRRRAKHDKAIAGGALLSSGGMDEGIDRLLKT
jgi:hypothetical protein